MLREESSIQGFGVPASQQASAGRCAWMAPRVAWRLHWSQRLSLISSSLTLRRSSFVTAKPINQDDTNKVADIAHWPDIAEQRGLRQPESRRITVISFEAAAKPDRRAESRENSPCQITLTSMLSAYCTAKTLPTTF